MNSIERSVIARNVYRNNLGVKIESLRVRGTNGAEYYGRKSVDWSQAIRLRRCKA